LNVYATVAALGVLGRTHAIVWLTGRHPYWAATIAAAFIAVIVALARIVVRSLRAALGGARRQLAATTH
jgi:hypothetical protein